MTVEEPYLTEKAFGECDISLPFTVPQSKVFVMGDNRSVSIDSRYTEIGCISQEQIIGKLILRIWPLNAISVVK
jgi:signal peptidase I